MERIKKRRETRQGGESPRDDKLKGSSGAESSAAAGKGAGTEKAPETRAPRGVK